MTREHLARHRLSTIAVVVGFLVPPLHVAVLTPWSPVRSSPPDPLSGTERGSGGEDLTGDQGVRTATGRGGTRNPTTTAIVESRCLARCSRVIKGNWG